MAYATLSQIKEWLTLGSETKFDTELTNILTAVDEEINNILSQFTTTPVTTNTNVLADIEAEWCAGVFKLRRAPKEANVLLEDAKKRLDEFIKNNFMTEFRVE